jgi:hypothetical protein
MIGKKTIQGIWKNKMSIAQNKMPTPIELKAFNNNCKLCDNTQLKTLFMKLYWIFCNRYETIETSSSVGTRDNPTRIQIK